jgi:plasmid stabilization system protein ParE
MRIRWTPAAVDDLRHISAYLKDHHPHYQQPTLRKFYEAILSLKEWPRRGRPGAKTEPANCSSLHGRTLPSIA